VRTESVHNYGTTSINVLNKLPITDKTIVLRDKTSVTLIKHVLYPVGLFPAKNAELAHMKRKHRVFTSLSRRKRRAKTREIKTLSTVNGITVVVYSMTSAI
jgi:hypothetical protein